MNKFNFNEIQTLESLSDDSSNEEKVNKFNKMKYSPYYFINRNFPKTKEIENNACNRLYHMGLFTKQKKQFMQVQHNQKELERYSFKPKVNKKSQMITQKKAIAPIYLRANKVISESKEKIKKLKDKLNESSSQIITYKPKINKSYMESSEDVFLRLSKPKKISTKTSEISYTFKPDIYSSHFTTNSDSSKFIERQNKYNKERDERMNNLKMFYEQVEDIKCPFKPNISTTNDSDFSIRVAVKRQREKYKEKFMRLSTDHFHRKQYYNEEFTFTPKINRYKPRYLKEKESKEIELLNGGEDNNDEEIKKYSKLNKSVFNISYLTEINNDNSHVSYVRAKTPTMKHRNIDNKKLIHKLLYHM